MSNRTELGTEDAVLDMLADAHGASQWVLIAPDGRTWVSDNIQIILVAVAAEFDGAAPCAWSAVCGAGSDNFFPV